MAKKKTKLADVVKAAHEAGCKVDIKLEEKPRMPMRFPKDPKEVTFLLDESERVTALGNKWLEAKVPNQMAAGLAIQQGWAYALAASWLRCKLKGEFDAKKS